MEDLNKWYVARYLDADNKIRTVACDDKYKLADHLDTIGIHEYSIVEQSFAELAEIMKAMDRNNT